MSIAGLLITLIITVVLLVWVTAPFWRANLRHLAQDSRHDEQRERWLVYYERVLTNIRDLEEDFSTGKMNPDDYEAEREMWVQRGIQLLKALAQLNGQNELSDDEPNPDDAVENVIAAYRAKHQ